MNKGVVVVYLSPLGKPLRRAHQRFLLEADARAIAKLKNYEFGGYYQNRHVGRLFFVPDQTLLLEEEDLASWRVTHCAGFRNRLLRPRLGKTLLFRRMPKARSPQRSLYTRQNEAPGLWAKVRPREQNCWWI